MTTTSVQSIWLLLLDDTLWNPIARCTRCRNLRYARIAWDILRRNFIQSKLSTNWSSKKDQGATTGLLCVLQNGSPIFHSFLDTMLTQNTWCWWAGGVPWCWFETRLVALTYPSESHPYPFWFRRCATEHSVRWRYPENRALQWLWCESNLILITL